MRKKNIQKSNQKSKERKLLVATLALAALIVGGSTFAWFTSTDLVTNKLSSTGGLKVVATESFDRPDNWTPEVTVKKEVGALNAGNIDAFVRLSLPKTQATVTRLSDGATVDSNVINAAALKTSKVRSATGSRNWATLILSSIRWRARISAPTMIESGILRAYIFSPCWTISAGRTMCRSVMIMTISAGVSWKSLFIPPVFVRFQRRRKMMRLSRRRQKRRFRSLCDLTL